MNTFKKVTAILILIFYTACSNQKKEADSTDKISSEINSYLNKSMELNNIPGLALAVIEGDTVVYESYFGKASLEDSILVDNNTIFRVFSTTKLITTTGVFQLVEDGKLDLEDTISKYLDDLPDQWKQVKIENLLSHSSGLPNFIRYKSTLTDEELMEKLYQDKMQFVTGLQHSYNQTNYWLLAKIIEKITGTAFDNYILNNQFGDSTNGVLFSSNALEIIPNRATRYYYNGRNKTFEKDKRNDGKRGYPGNGLNISLNKFMEWDKRLKNNSLLNEKTKALMWSPFQFTNNFTYQEDDFLYGWGLYRVNSLKSYGFSGGNLAAYRYFPDNNTTIILLSNGYQTPAFDIIVNDIARLTLPELKNKNLTIEQEAMNLLENNHLDKAVELLKKLKEENPGFKFDNLKWNINSIGNSYTWNDEPEKGIEVFKLASEAFPNWWVSFSSLAENYDQQKDTLNTIKNYEKAVLLNEKNEFNYNEQMIKRALELKDK